MEQRYLAIGTKNDVLELERPQAGRAEDVPAQQQLGQVTHDIILWRKNILKYMFYFNI